MGKGLLGGFAAGVAIGLDRGIQRNKEQERQQREDDMRQEEHDARMREVNRQEGDRIALQNAARPVAVNDNGASVNYGDGQQHVYDDANVASSDARQFNRLQSGGAPEQADAAAPPDGPSLAQAQVAPAVTVNGTAYPDQTSAATAAAAQNSPDATNMRIAQAMRSRGNVTGAMQYEASARQSQVAGADLADRTWNRKVRDAMARGHEGLADLVSQSQGGDLEPHQLKAVPSADGKNVTYNKVNPDGSLTPLPNLTFTNDQDGVVRAGYMLDRSVTPETRYKNMVAEDKQTAAVSQKENELELRKRQLEEVQIPNTETRAQLADVRAQLAKIQADRGSGGVGREERLRYTSLFTDAGRRMQDTQKTINSLQRDPLFMRNLRKDPNSAEAQQMQQLQSDLKSHQDERQLYQGLLAGSQSTGAPAGDATPTPAPAAGPAAAPAAGAASSRGPDTKVSPATQAARDADRVPILQAELTKAQGRASTSTDPDEKARAQRDVQSVQKELDALQRKGPLRLANAAPKNGAPAKAGGSRDTPVKVTSAQERDQLQPGTYYVAPDGNTYIKQ